MSTILRIGGVDPGMSKTGIVAVEIDAPNLGPREVFVPGGDDVRILYHHTVRPKGDSFVERLNSLGNNLRLALDENGDPNHWCLEDPREVTRGVMHKRKRSTDVTLGMACGIAYAALVECAPWPIVLVPVHDWLPKTRNRRGGIHPMKHEMARDWLETRWPALLPLSDDECFASGMVIWYASRGGIGALT